MFMVACNKFNVIEVLESVIVDCKRLTTYSNRQISGLFHKLFGTLPRAAARGVLLSLSAVRTSELNVKSGSTF
jgi:hypothetical protein